MAKRLAGPRAKGVVQAGLDQWLADRVSFALMEYTRPENLIIEEPARAEGVRSYLREHLAAFARAIPIVDGVLDEPEDIDPATTDPDKGKIRAKEAGDIPEGQEATPEPKPEPPPKPPLPTGETRHRMVTGEKAE